MKDYQRSSISGSRQNTNRLHRLMLLLASLAFLVSMENLQHVVDAVSVTSHDKRLNTITDEVIEKMVGGLPSLGRGYSVSTNSCQQVCFREDGPTEHVNTFNYDCEY